jgi:hypothetical protein
VCVTPNAFADGKAFSDVIYLLALTTTNSICELNKHECLKSGSRIGAYFLSSRPSRKCQVSSFLVAGNIVRKLPKARLHTVFKAIPKIVS